MGLLILNICMQKKPHLSSEKRGFHKSPIELPPNSMVAVLEEGLLYISVLGVP
jgi:hypothetical protein